jgi:hypothetical protein
MGQELISGPSTSNPTPTEGSRGWIDSDLGQSIGSWVSLGPTEGARGWIDSDLGQSIGSTEGARGWIDLDLGQSIGSWLRWLNWKSRDRHLWKANLLRVRNRPGLGRQMPASFGCRSQGSEAPDTQGWVLTLCLSPDRLRSSGYSILIGAGGFYRLLATGV